jgi:dTDP-glucose 4,6-dehydratase
LDYRGKTVLLTGASGFIGSHVAEELVTCGASLRAFLHYNSRGDEGNLRCVPSEIRREIDVVYGDLTDPDAVKKAVRGVTHVFHLGALIAIPYSYVHPFSFVQTNVVGTANILNACLEAGVDRLITASTSEVYGTAVTIPMDETHRLHPQSPYAASKASADHLAESYARSFDLPVVIVRPFNTFGPATVDSGGNSNDHRPGPSSWFHRHRIHDAHSRLQLRQGHCAWLRIGRRRFRRNREVYNLGTGEEHSVAEVIETVSTILGTDY